MIGESTVDSITDAEFLKRAIAHAMRNRKKGDPAWVAVSKTFALGSTFSAQLCRRFGIDPDMVKR